MHSKQDDFSDLRAHSHAKRIGMRYARVHLRSTGMAKVLRLCMHSHVKKIEMCNACVYLRSTGMARVLEITHAFAGEGKSEG